MGVLIVPRLYGHLGHGDVLRLFFIFFSFLLFSGIEIEPPVMGSSAMLVLVRQLLLLIC